MKIQNIDFLNMVRSRYILNDPDAITMIDTMINHPRLNEFSLIEDADDDYTMSDLEGDSYDPKCHPDLDPDHLASDRESFHDRVNRDGVWSYVLIHNEVHRCDCPYCPKSTSKVIESIGGFIGQDFFGSGHDLEFVSTMNDILSKS